MPVLAVIPARLGSTRLAQKPLQLLGGEPLVVRVLERVRQVPGITEVVVATDADEVRRVVERVGGHVAMTSHLHQSGTERVAEVLGRPEFASYDLVVNIQGDEPFLPVEAVRRSVMRVEAGDDIGTAAVPLPADRADDPARVKVVLDSSGRALYFSRARIPYQRDVGPAVTPPPYWQHLGVYAYSRAALARWVAAAATMLEETERLEQLRALYLGMRIGVALLDRPAMPGIDTPDDLAAAERHWIAQAIRNTER